MRQLLAGFLPRFRHGGSLLSTHGKKKRAAVSKLKWLLLAVGVYAVSLSHSNFYFGVVWLIIMVLFPNHLDIRKHPESIKAPVPYGEIHKVLGTDGRYVVDAVQFKTISHFHAAFFKLNIIDLLSFVKSKNQKF